MKTRILHGKSALQFCNIIKHKWQVHPYSFTFLYIFESVNHPDKIRHENPLSFSSSIGCILEIFGVGPKNTIFVLLLLLPKICAGYSLFFGEHWKEHIIYFFQKNTIKKSIKQLVQLKLVQLCILPVWMWIPTHIRSWLCKVDVYSFQFSTSSTCILFSNPFLLSISVPLNHTYSLSYHFFVKWIS